MLTFIVLPLGLGIWFTVGLGHWRAWVPWITVATIVGLLFSLDTLVAQRHC